MKMAKASQRDLDAAMDLHAFLLSMSEGRSPAIAVAEFDLHGYDDLVRRDAPAVDYLLRAEERGNLFRVVWGLREMEDEVQRLRAEVDQQRTRAEAAEAELRKEVGQ